jgi:hypothetical protein
MSCLLPLLVFCIAEVGVFVLCHRMCILPLLVFCIAEAGVFVPCHRMCISTCHIGAAILSGATNHIVSCILQYLYSLLKFRATVYNVAPIIGGHKSRFIKYKDISTILSADILQEYPDIRSHDFSFIDYVDPSTTDQYLAKCYLQLKFPMDELVHFITNERARQIAKMHGLHVGSRTSVAGLSLLFKEHLVCNICSTHFTIVSMQPSQKERKKAQILNWQLNRNDEEKLLSKKQMQKRVAKHRSNKNKSDSNIYDLASTFPPPPVDKVLSHKIIKSSCSKLEPESFEEKGCAVCGHLTPVSSLSRLSAVKTYLHVLEAPGFTRQERQTASKKIREFPLAIDHSCKQICDSCRVALRKGIVPKMALARGLWLGAVPDVLSSLRYVEKMLVARIRHSFCSVRISSGMRKMKAHAIAYRQPTPKVYNILPPPKEDIEEVLAIMFTGPCKPTPADFQRTPFLVRRNHVKRALEWLILNHADYEDVSISINNLDNYPEDMPPVSVEYKELKHNKIPEGTSVHDMEVEDGTEDGECAFTVHGLTGEQLNVMTANAVKIKALQHLNSQGKFLAVGHDENPESIWHNPQLYPQMFPWLFPYGLGGIGSVGGISDKEHKKRLLMYHDKRFQTDPDFPFIAFSHEQIKTASTQSFLLADKHIFNDIKQRILTLDNNVLKALLDRMNSNEIVKPETEEEHKCFQIIKDLDHVAGPVKGSNTSKKWMRNEIWSLIYHRGAPFWYITISPADVKHPLCIYFADKKEKFEVEILPYDARLRLVCQNPVAGARFFDFLVRLFISEILGIGENDIHQGLYGDVIAYYGTVEQQGRLALHLHMLIWLMGNLTPQEMRERILDPNSDWQKRLIAWLESCHIGEFMRGTQDEVLENVARCSKQESYRDPTETLPQPPPPLCESKHDLDENCDKCDELSKWWKYFDNVVDDLVSKSNVHNCDRGINKDGSSNKKYTSCKDNKYGKCKARFPRPIYSCTEVDSETGALSIKKHEPWINFFSPVLTYILRCNTDVTCLWSGTALKAVILYVSDYITKTSLKTHVIFEAIRGVFDKNNDVIASSLSEKEKGRKLINKIVNALSTRAEMGAPMVCMYLLDNPDHYTNHTFIPFYWHSYVAEAQRVWEQVASSTHVDKVALIKSKQKIVGISPVYDYIYRPTELNNMSLYEWAVRCERKKNSQNSKKRQCTSEELTEECIADSQSLDEENGISNGEINSENSCNDDSWRKDKNIHEDDGLHGHCTLNDNKTSIKLSKNMYRFQKEHPLYASHVCLLKPSKANTVVNFIGRVLPRCDQGDREFYCLTMMAFFKPWRSGLDLKPQTQSWDEIFTEHEFTKREIQLMRNFNIKYECYDARDDFHAQMKAGATHNDFLVNCFDDGDGDEIEHDPYDESKNEDLLQDFDIQKVCKAEMNRLKDAREIKDVLQRTGWLNEAFEPTSITEDGVSSSSHLPPVKWKAMLQNKKQSIIDQKTMQSSNFANQVVPKSFVPNSVKIMDKAYLERQFHTTEHNNSIDVICEDFSLNEEQERAFRIIANHVVIPNSEPLKMYIGGMGGTGKSQVLKAVSKFFERRNEAHRFIIVAPTGSAAALVSGSTYHSVFGINDMNNDAHATKTLIQVRTRLLGVDYIFMDEVSMLSCHDMYKISAQLCKVMNEPSKPFGGLNMLFAGDFAQLPPPVGGENISLYSRTVGQFGTWMKAQEDAIGRALWHQVVTVVILRQNMRQKTQSEDDNRYRKALVNMRYKDCTPDDIQFLRTRITSHLPGRPCINDPDFKFASIITAKNAQKDEINKLGCQLFAQHTGQQLVDFYSEDTLKITEDFEKSKKRKSAKRKLTKLTVNQQKVLWNLPHSSADKPVPGKLSLCKGLPVMIKCNIATELCITNGQEASIVDWQSSVGQDGQNILDVLFVKLKSPPKPVQLDGLSENIVPLTRSTVNLTCKLPDGSKVTISRSQIEVLPNFAMTDYASQGKTRPMNPVDLNNCRSHQAYYTALSRSSTSEGTVILQGFDPKKITGRASGALRQEFRDLELLDEITKLRYLGKLPISVHGDRRNALIHTYREHKGLTYIPSTVHPAIKWSKRDPMLDPISDELPWTIVTKDSMPSIAPTTQMSMNTPSTPLKSIKRKEITPEKEHRTKINKCNLKGKNNAESVNIDVQSLTPVGTSWHQNSCAYDAVLCILHSIWSCNKNVYTDEFRNMNDILAKLSFNFTEHASGNKTLDSTRDDMRRYLHQLAPTHFRWGQFAAISILVEYLFSMPITTIQNDFICNNGHISETRRTNNTCCLLAINSTIQCGSVAQWMQELKEECNSRLTCPSCSEKMVISHKLLLPLPFIAFDFSRKQLEIDHMFNVSINNDECTYRLQGIVYYSDSHFTARVIHNNGMIWFHDGIATKNNLLYEGTLHNFAHSLSSCRNKNAITVIYTKV